MSNRLRIPAWYYQHFDADHSLDVPAENYGGWKKETLEFAFEHTAVVFMHAWDCGAQDEFPGWYRAVESIPRSTRICQTVFPRLAAAVRASGLRLFHVVSGGEYHRKYPGYAITEALAGSAPSPLEQVQADPSLEKLRDFRYSHVFCGKHNTEDIRRGFDRIDFAPEAKPLDHEAIAATSEELFALCKAHDINHLIYAGFTNNGCLMLSPGGMIDMTRRGAMCSIIREATTAIENRESARTESHKEAALWEVALLFGFVFDLDDVLSSLASARTP